MLDRRRYEDRLANLDRIDRRVALLYWLALGELIRRAVADHDLIIAAGVALLVLIDRLPGRTQP